MLLVTGFLFKYKFWEKKVFLFFQPTWLRCCVVALEGGGGGGCTAIYGLYRYVPLWRVWFSIRLL